MYVSTAGKAGDVQKFEVKIDAKDVTQAVVTATVFQDIFTPCWSLQVIFRDTGNLILTLPIKQGSEIEVKVKTKTGNSDGLAKFGKFIVYKISDNVLENSNTLSYVVYAVKEAIFQNLKISISKSFKDKKITNIATECAGELGINIEKEDTDGKISMIIPNWTPFKAIEWCAKVAQNKKEKASDFLFFQSKDDLYTFKSMETLYGENSNKRFFLRPANIFENGEPKYDYGMSIIAYQWTHFDALRNMTSGYFGSKVLSYDFINKQWKETSFNFSQDAKEDAERKSWTPDLFSNTYEASKTFSPLHKGLYTDGSYLDSANSWIGSRKSALMKPNQERLIIQVAGQAEFYELIGKAVKVDLPSQEEFTGNKNDKYRKKKFLVASIAHIISKESYIANFELFKKRLEKQVS